MTIRMKFDNADRITIHGMHYKPMVHTDNGVVLDQIACPGITDSYTFDDLSKLLASCDMRVARGYFDRTTREEALGAALNSLASYPRRALVLFPGKEPALRFSLNYSKKGTLKKQLKASLLQRLS